MTMNEKSPTKKEKNETNCQNNSDRDKSKETIIKNKGKDFIPTDWTGERKGPEKPFKQDIPKKGDSMEHLFLNEEDEGDEDESFYLGSDDLGSESSQDSGDESNEYQSENDHEEMGELEKSEQKVEQHAEPVGSLENEVDELLKDIQEHASEYNQNNVGKERDFELVEPGTLRSGKRKRDFFGDLAQFPDFHDDLTVVGRGFPNSSGAQSKASGSNSLNPSKQ